MISQVVDPRPLEPELNRDSYLGLLPIPQVVDESGEVTNSNVYRTYDEPEQQQQANDTEDEIRQEKCRTRGYIASFVACIILSITLGAIAYFNHIKADEELEQYYLNALTPGNGTYDYITQEFNEWLKANAKEEVPEDYVEIKGKPLQGLWNNSIELNDEQAQSVLDEVNSAFLSDEDYYCQLGVYTLIQTDKQVYKPGDYIFVEAYAVDSKNKLPFLKDINGVDPKIYAQLRIEKDGTQYYLGQPEQLKNGTFSYAIKIPQTVIKGTYEIVLTSVNEITFGKSKRQIQILDFERPKYQIKQVLDKNSYIAGETAKLELEIRNSDGSKLLAGSTVAIMYDDGVNFKAEESNIRDEKVSLSIPIPSNAMISFPLGLTIIQGFQALIDTRYQISIPIINLENLALDIQTNSINGPKAGFLNTYYVQLYQFDELRKWNLMPVDFQVGAVYKDGEIITNFVNFKGGMGSFELTPEPSTLYEVRVRVGTKEISTNLDKILPGKRFSSYHASFPRGTVVKRGESLIAEFQWSEPITEENKIRLELRAFDTNFTSAVVPVPVSNKPGKVVLQISSDQVYEFSEAGGLYQAKVQILDDFYYQGRVKEPFETLNEQFVFFEPKLDYDDAVSMETNQEIYQPGDSVNLKLEIDTDKLPDFDPSAQEEQILAQITVTDYSALQETPQSLVPFDFGSLIHLQKDTDPLGFLESNRDQLADKYQRPPAYLMNYFDLSLDKEQRTILKDEFQILLGRHYYQSCFYDAGGNCDRTPLKQDEGFFRSRDAKCPVNRFNTPTYKIATELDQIQKINRNISPDKYKFDPEIRKYYDFMREVDVLNFENYLHQRRAYFNAFPQLRLDFTETIAFVPAQQLTKEGNKLVLRVDNFTLPDQTTQFDIKVNLFSSRGRYGQMRKLVSSTLPVYSQFEVPRKMVYGDNLTIPVSILNNMPSDQIIVHEISTREIIGNEMIILSKQQGQTRIKKNGLLQLSFNLDSANLTQTNGTLIYAQVKIFNNGVLIENLVKRIDIVQLSYPKYFSTGGMVGKSRRLSDRMNTQYKSFSWILHIPENILKLEQFEIIVFKSFSALVKKSIQHFSDSQIESLSDNMASISSNVQSYKALQKLIESNNELDIASLKAEQEETRQLIRQAFAELKKYETENGGLSEYGSGDGYEPQTAQALRILLEEINQNNLVASKGEQDYYIKRQDLQNFEQRSKEWLQSRDGDRMSVYAVNQEYQYLLNRYIYELSDITIVYALSHFEEFTWQDLLGPNRQIISTFMRSRDPYFFALFALAAHNKKDLRNAIEAVNKLIVLLDNQGRVAGSNGSPNIDRGVNLDVKVTAYSALALIRVDPWNNFSQIQAMTQYLLSNLFRKEVLSKDTVAVILEFLKELYKLDEYSSQLTTRGKLDFSMDGKLVQQIDLNDKQGQDFFYVDLSQSTGLMDMNTSDLARRDVRFQLTTTELDRQHNFLVAFESSGEMRVDSIEPKTSSALYFLVDTTTIQSRGAQIVQYSIILQSKRTDFFGEGKIVVKLHIPTCYRVDTEQLITLRNSGAFDSFSYSVDNSQLLLYYSKLAHREVKTVNIQALQVFEGTCKTGLHMAYPLNEREQMVVSH